MRVYFDLEFTFVFFLKPHNICFNIPGYAKLIDFDGAITLEDGEKCDGEEAVVGTIGRAFLF